MSRECMSSQCRCEFHTLNTLFDLLYACIAEKGAADDDLFEVSEEALLSTDFDDDAEFEPEEEEYDPNELDELAGVRC